MGKRVYLLVIVIGIILGIYVIDWSFLRGSVTEYRMFCYSNKCTSNGFTKYYPDKTKAVVISIDSSDSLPSTLKNCSIIDRKNWSCQDESFVQGFSNGQYKNNSEFLRDSLPATSRLDWLLNDGWKYEFPQLLTCLLMNFRPQNNRPVMCM